MRSLNFSVPRALGRLLAIFVVSVGSFVTMTGFVPLNDEKRTPDEDQAQRYVAPSAHEFMRQFRSITPHRLLVDKQELRCLALNIYWEARSEPLDGQLAVAGVTLNRVADPKFPETICGVVKHSRSARLHRCQFSWWCDGKKDTPVETAAWKRAQQLARLFVAGIYTDPTEDALWYHADYVKPVWADKLTRTAKIGRHIFYRGQEKRTASLY